MSATVFDSCPLSTTFGSSERTTRARVPSSESSLPRMMSLLITRWIKLWYAAPSGKTSGNSGGGKPPLGGGGPRAGKKGKKAARAVHELKIDDELAQLVDRVALEQRFAFDHDQHVVLAGRKFVRNLLV